MSFPEIGFRILQNIQKKYEKYGNAEIDHKKQDYTDLLFRASTSKKADIPRDFAKEFLNYHVFEFFGTSIKISPDIDWHLDIISDKRFPVSFAKDINIRSDKYGSAKVVWEINRLQFLLPVAVRYATEKEKGDLHLFINIIDSWINNNPYLKGVNWYSNIEVNIRLIVWYFCWQVLMSIETLKDDEDFTCFAKDRWLPSIYEHCIYSYRNPSKYSSANNHLISEYAGLFIAANCWSFKESDNWKAYAQQGLEKEIVLQHSDNGINKEEAAEYIQFITDFFLLAYAVGESSNMHFSDNYKGHLFKIIDYINNLLDIKGNYCKYGDEDDGKVLVVSIDPHFNNFLSILTSGTIIFRNSDFKSGLTHFDLKNWLLWGSEGKDIYGSLHQSTIPRSSKFYTDEGHFIFRKQSENHEIYLHFDVAPLGFLSIAAHGHADALSLALHVDGYPFICDVGTYTYHTEPEWRKYFISTLAHNTVSINGVNQASQAGPTMWLDHYKSTVLEASQNANVESVSGTHNGYEKLACTHVRKVSFYRTKDAFEIEDNINIKVGFHSIEIPFHLHPQVNVERISSNQVLLGHASVTKKLRVTIDSNLDVLEYSGNTNPMIGWFSPSFQIKEPSMTIIGKKEINQSMTFKTIIEMI